MTRTTTIALAAVAALALAAGTAAYAKGFGRHGAFMPGPEQMKAADADKSGDISPAEFAAAIDGRIGGTDANADGVFTVDEVAAEIQRQMAQRMAEHLIARFDGDGDGKLTKAEVESHEKKVFALLDRNDDGKIALDELPKHGWGRHGGWGGHGGPGMMDD